MRVAFIGDIVGRPGRDMIQKYLKKIRAEYEVDFVIANYENASHGFGLTKKNADELVSFGVDSMTGGNHTWDKKEIVPLLSTHELLRPDNYPDEVGGTGCKVYEVAGERLAIINLMGHFCMPQVDNAFRKAKERVAELRADGVKNIFIDFHAEATSEKRAMLMMLKGEVSAIIGTHTHVGTDDLQIVESTAYLSDIGLSGCRDNVIGMDKEAPIKQFLTGLKSHFDIPKNCKKILQIAIMDINDGKCLNAFKLKYFCDGRILKTEAWVES
ncbi:metallophosphoesterase [Sulfurimonas hongkongensis]|uniref:Metallophosphoesterase n=1 Tax=Sulfurimonas hongkongensis TaxID=1172190 RepID=T0JP25_9BACT|nr:TIGR00282 family metallophosphoesterase [Sulfurimonas hongkongensis]EQB39886.1 metallophosphoesterase [Sulfurimonas hongkongensis]